MSSKKHTNDPPDSGYVLGSMLDLSDWDGELLARSSSGHIEYIIGYRERNQSWELPYYHPTVGIRAGGKKVPGRFIALDRGTLYFSSFLHSDIHYKLITDRWIIFPKGASSYFGVVNRADRVEDVELTRQIFGTTFDEIERVAGAFAKIIGRDHNEIFRLPRSTFSKTQSNDCDLSRAFIPKNFPYLAFEQAQHEWSHISFHGFYRLLSFVCGNAEFNPVSRAMRERGIEDSVLRRLIGNSEVYGSPLVINRC